MPLIGRVGERALWAAAFLQPNTAMAHGISTTSWDIDRVPEFYEADAQRRDAKRPGRYPGFGLGILMTLVLYLALLADPYGERFGGAPLLVWLSPLGVAALLAIFPRTRGYSAGFLAGVALSWIVGIPTCVVVTLSTVPMG